MTRVFDQTTKPTVHHVAAALIDAGLAEQKAYSIAVNAMGAAPGESLPHALDIAQRLASIADSHEKTAEEMRDKAQRIDRDGNTIRKVVEQLNATDEIPF